MTEPTGTTGTTGTTDQTTGTGDSTGAGNGQNAGTGTSTAQDTERKYSQADIDAAITARLARERKSADEKAVRERQQAQEATLKEQAKWEELARQHETRVKELEPALQTTQERYTALSEKLGKQIDAGMKDWPADARKMVPMTEDIAARLDAYDAMKSLLDKGTLAPRQPGNGANPRPTAGPDGAQQMEDRLRASGRYTAF